MIERLQECQSTCLTHENRNRTDVNLIDAATLLTTEEILRGPAYLCDTYIPNILSSAAPTPSSSIYESEPEYTSLRPLETDGLYLERLQASKRLSDTWEVLSESGASLVIPEERLTLSKSGSVSSWKSSGNGQLLGDLGGKHHSSS